MPIIIKKPFEPFDVKSEGIKDINTKDINATNRLEQIHPEFEEKPVVEPISQTSEDVHGGSELTFSLPNSSQSSGQEQENGNNQADQDAQSDTSASNADTNNDNAADNSDNKGAQEQQNVGGEKSNDNNETSDADRQSNEGGGNNTQEPQSTATDQIAQEQENANAESSGDNQDSENGNGDNDTEDQGQENDNEQNSENDVEGEESESEDAGKQTQSGTYNTQQVVDVASGDINNAKYYQTEFYRFIELIAEEKAKTYDTMGSEEYNVKKLMFRQYERKPLSSYKMSRVRESVVIILDNSGSMQWWADNLATLANLAMQRSDAEVYLAPNGYIEEMLYPRHQLVNHDEVMKRLRNRKIIYVGDFDGADTPIELSWYNDVIWICPEERYTHFLDHDWVHYDESRFKGAFLRVFTLQELFGAFKKLLSMPVLRFWYDLCNETHKCGGDEE